MPSAQMTRDWRAYHRAFGEHSLIPNCCIEFFVNEWDSKELWRQNSLPIVKANNERPTQYVMCPECLVNNREVKIHFCDDRCVKEYRKWGIE
jgi:hypothetical protein